LGEEKEKKSKVTKKVKKKSKSPWTAFHGSFVFEG
jgi:hypothetical protein